MATATTVNRLQQAAAVETAAPITTDELLELGVLAGRILPYDGNLSGSKRSSTLGQGEAALLATVAAGRVVAFVPANNYGVGGLKYGRVLGLHIDSWPGAENTVYYLTPNGGGWWAKPSETGQVVVPGDVAKAYGRLLRARRSVAVSAANAWARRQGLQGYRVRTGLCADGHVISEVRPAGRGESREEFRRTVGSMFSPSFTSDQG